jgi:SAM-dependent methyltransferase
MANTKPFDRFSREYEEWFVRYKAVYDSEVEALRGLLPGEAEKKLRGLEIGVGSGLFASRLGIREGVDPSPVMARKARKRGIEVTSGVAEDLPFENESFDFTLMVTAICFVRDPGKALEEIWRVLKPGGSALFGFVDEDSPLGQSYLDHKEENIFYRDATFYGASEVMELLGKKGFSLEAVRQTVFCMIDEVRNIQKARDGHGTGGFVVIRARRGELA